MRSWCIGSQEGGMFFPIRFKTSVQLSPIELQDDFDAIILAKLQGSLEGVCSRYGYIKAGTLAIVKRSAGKLMKQHFNGYVYFTVICRGDVCNPAKDSIIQAKVMNKNALGILAESYIEGTEAPVLDIIVPKKTAGIISEIDVDMIEIGDMISIKVIGKRFHLNDAKISIIGKVMKEAEALGSDVEEVGVVDDDGAASESEYSDGAGLESEVDGGDDGADGGDVAEVGSVVEEGGYNMYDNAYEEDFGMGADGGGDSDDGASNDGGSADGGDGADDDDVDDGGFSD